MDGSKSRLPQIALLGAAAALTIAAALMLFSAFMVYDDEGYVLFSLKNYIEHGRLYGAVYSQYGPFPYALYDFLHHLGLPLTHNATRLVTLAAWSGAAVLSAGAVLRFTRLLPAALAALAGTFVYLWIMVNEPTHPGGLIAFITAAMAAAGGLALADGRIKTWAAIAGTGSVALLLTKINVGAFAVLSWAAFVCLHSPRVGLRRAAPWIFGPLFAVVTLALMQPLLGLEWVRSYALIFSVSAVTALFAATRDATILQAGAWMKTAMVGAASLALLVTASVYLRGTSAAELVDGMVFGPLRHPARFNLPFHWSTSAHVAAIVSCIGFGAAVAGHKAGSAERVGQWVAWLRILATAAMLLLLASFPGQNPNVTLFAYGAPCLWLFLWPLEGESAAHRVALRWIGLLLLGQFLHAYPVPGSQIGWGTFLAVPLGMIGAWRAVESLTLKTRMADTAVFRHRMVVRGLLLIAVLVMSVRFGRVAMRYHDSRDLNLNGAEILRLPDANTATYRILTLNAVAHADMVFSLPGMFSFNLWSGLPAPTLANVTHWFSLLDVAQQEEIIRSLEAHPRAAVIVQAELVDFLASRGFAPKGPLYEYLMSKFKPAFALDGFEFRIRNDRHAAPFLTADVLERRSPATAEERFDTLLRLSLLLPATRRVATIEITSVDDRVSAPLVLTAENSRVEMNLTNLGGDAMAAPATTSFPLDVSRPCLVGIYFNRAQLTLSPERTLIVLRDAAGRELALVRLRP